MAITTPLKIIVTVFLIAMIGTMFYLLDWQQKYAELEQSKTQLAELNDKLAKQKDLVKDLTNLNRRKDELEKKLAQVVQTNLVPEKPEMFVANYIKEVEKLTLEERARTGDDTFEIVSITPGVLTSQSPAAGAEGGEEVAGEDAGGETPDALKQFPTRMFQMSMKGQYTTLIDFLYQLGALKLERLVTINKIALSPSTKDVGNGSPTLSISIPITAYMRQGG